MKPNEFLLNSDWASLKNDTQGNVISATVSAGQIFNISNPLLAQSFLTVGTRNAGIRARGKSSKYSPWKVGLTLYTNVPVSIPSDPGSGVFDLTLYCSLQRVSPTQMRLSIGTEAGSGAPNMKIEETQTITFVFSTFLSPTQ